MTDTKRGPKPDRLKIDGDWKDAVGEALKKPPPKNRPADDQPEEPIEKAD